MVPKSISPVPESPPRGGGPSSDASVPSDPPNSVDPTQDQDQDVPLSVSPSSADGQDPAVVPLGEINETKKNEMSGKLITSGDDMEADKDKDKDKDNDNDKDGKLVEGDVNKVDMIDVGGKKTACRKSKRIRSPNKELFPLKQPAKKKVKTAKNQNEHVPVKYQTTRRINIGKHINHITKKEEK